ncbi:MAG: TadE/TadG family type IV pilus assembly protein [Planctomycetota bacterium]
MRSHLSRRPNRQHDRSGVAAVEFAVCLPVLILLVLGSIEAASFMFLKQGLNVAAYEGIRVAVRDSGTAAEARSVAENILNARGIRNANINFSVADVSNVPRGEIISVTVSASTNANSPLGGQFLPDRTLDAAVFMVKE